MSRNSGIEIRFVNGTIPKGVKEKYDIEFSSKENSEILWIHSNGFKPFARELFNYLGTVTEVINRVALFEGKNNIDYLNLYIEGEVGEMGEVVNGVTYKNIRWSELPTIDLGNVKLRKELAQQLELLKERSEL